MAQIKLDRDLFDLLVEYFNSDDIGLRADLEPKIKVGIADKLRLMSIHDLNRLDYPRAGRGLPR